MVLRGFGKSLNSVLSNFSKSKRFDKKVIIELKNDMLKVLLEADIDLNTITGLLDVLETRSLNEKLPSGLERKKAIINIIYEELTKIMGKEAYKLSVEKNRVNVIMMVGIQGSGKTTTVAKLAYMLKSQGWRVGLVCADNWRAGAYDQLKELGEKVDVEVYGNKKQKKGLKLAAEGLNHMLNAKKNVVIIDTAGRHMVDKPLLNEMKAMEKKIKPSEIILVIDGTAGNQIYGHAKAFAEYTKVGSIIVSKLDGTAKGGGAITASAAANVPVKYIGVGEGIDNLEEYDPKKLVSRILGMGDLESLLEEVKKANISVTEDQAKELMKGKMSYNDMLNMFDSMKSMGSLRKILDFMPGGLSHKLDDNMLDVSKENMKSFKVIISSMTKAEKSADVKIGFSRMQRIADGSGKPVETVKLLVNQKREAERLIKQMTKPRRKKGEGEFPFNLPI